MKPFTRFLDASANLVLRILRIDPEEIRERVTEEEICIMTEAGAKSRYSSG